MEMKEKVLVSIKEEDQFLLLKRTGKTLNGETAGKEARPGIWEFPGGLVEDGEEPKRAAFREVAEETGLYVHTLEPRGTVESVSRDRYLKVQMFHARYHAGNLELSEEHDAFRWLPEETAVEMNPGEEISLDTLVLLTEELDPAYREMLDADIISLRMPQAPGQRLRL